MSCHKYPVFENAPVNVQISCYTIMISLSKRLATLRIRLRINVSDPGSNSTSITRRAVRTRQIQQVVSTYRKPSCLRNSARFVPLLQNRMAYERVAMVAAWPAISSQTPRIHHTKALTANKAAAKIDSIQSILLRIHVSVPCQLRRSRTHKVTYAICPMLFDTAYSRLLLMSSAENVRFFPPFLKTLPKVLAIIVLFSPSLL